MAGLWCMTVTLVFFLSAGSLAAVDQNKLAKLIQAAKNMYGITGMYCMALSIKSEDPKSLKQLFAYNPQELVQSQISRDNVYKGQRLAVAKVKQPEHAEWRVLKELNLVSDVGDLLVIYSYASACPSTCTNRKSHYNIIPKINDAINTGKWTQHVFVFEKVFKPTGSSGIEGRILIQALTNLAKSGITLANIFRCYRPQNVNGNFQCTSCSRNGTVEKTCVDYDAYRALWE